LLGGCSGGKKGGQKGIKKEAAFLRLGKKRPLKGREFVEFRGH
jgi:hypothetical protein